LSIPSTGAEVYAGALELELLFPNTVPPAAFDRLNVSAGVVVAVATLVVNSGDRFPALKLVTVPEPPPPEHAAPVIFVPLYSKHCPDVGAVPVGISVAPNVIPTTLTAFDPLVVASPESSAAVIALALPRMIPVSVLAVPVPPFATGNTPVTPAVREIVPQLIFPVAVVNWMAFVHPGHA